MSVYSRLPAFVLGFHGCDRSIAERILGGKSSHLISSNNEYDWLGSGIYFWENSPGRALEYAALLKRQKRKTGPQIVNPAVIGAIIDLGDCLNLLDAAHVRIVKSGYEQLVQACHIDGQPVPQNMPSAGRNDFPLRKLDCAVINYVHAIRRKASLAAYDSVRAAFVEGKPLYPKAGFCEQNHIQICVRNSDSIKGYFRPIDDRI